MYQVVLCSCPDDECAKRLATLIVKNKLAACVNIMSNMNSVYIWQEELVTESEVLLMIKTTSGLFGELQKLINDVHPYDVPEIIALNIQQGDKHYLDWITESLK